MLPDYENNPVKVLSFKILIAKVTFISFSLAFDKKASEHIIKNKNFPKTV